jgi:hypothetical protein
MLFFGLLIPYRIIWKVKMTPKYRYLIIAE